MIRARLRFDWILERRESDRLQFSHSEKTRPGRFRFRSEVRRFKEAQKVNAWTAGEALFFEEESLSETSASQMTATRINSNQTEPNQTPEPTAPSCRGSSRTLGKESSVKTSHYKLLKVSGGSTHYAEVTVERVTPSDGKLVRVSDEAFAWLKEEYGPNAWEWPACDGYRRAAVVGAEYALAHSSPAVDHASFGITIKKIEASPVDTSDSSVAFASCHAIWKLLQLTPNCEPRFEGNKIVFPE